MKFMTGPFTRGMAPNFVHLGIRKQRRDQLLVTVSMP
jgi:hypothetical protein